VDGMIFRHHAFDLLRKSFSAGLSKSYSLLLSTGPEATCHFLSSPVRCTAHRALDVITWLRIF